LTVFIYLFLSVYPLNQQGWCGLCSRFSCNMLTWSRQAFAQIIQTSKCKTADFLWMQEMISWDWVTCSLSTGCHNTISPGYAKPLLWLTLFKITHQIDTHLHNVLDHSICYKQIVFIHAVHFLERKIFFYLHVQHKTFLNLLSSTSDLSFWL